MSQDYTDRVPPYKAWKPRNLAWLLDDAECGEPSQPDDAADEGIRRAIDELSIKLPADHELSAVYDDGRVVQYERGDAWDRNTELHAPTPSFQAGQDRDTRAGLLVAAIALLAAAGIVVVIGMQPYWAMLAYWLNH